MKVNGKIIRVRASVRKVYGNYGITIVFNTKYGELIRTYNITRNNNGKSKLPAFLSLFSIDAPYGIADKPTLFCLAIEKLLKNTECELVIVESGNPKHPYNIEEINPILTVNTKYPTSQIQEAISTGEEGVR